MNGGFAIKIGADISAFERGQRDAVASAKRGAVEIATAYASSGRAIQAATTAVNIVQLASGTGLVRMAAATRLSLSDGFANLADGAKGTTAHVETLNEKLSALPAPIAAAVDAFAAFQAAKTVWTAFNQALEDTEVRLKRLNEIAKAAQTLGTGTTFLTQLVAQARQLGVETESLTSMLERAREASRVRIGEGKDAVNESAFQARARQHVAAGNLTAADLAPYGAAQTQEGQIRAVLDLLDKLKASQRDLAANDLGRTFFGADFEAKTRQGIDLIGAMRSALDGAKAAGSGLAPTPEEIARAQEFLVREEAIAATIRDAIAPAVHDFNELSDAGKRTWIEWEERVAGWVKWMGEGYLRLREVAAEVRKIAQSWGLIGQDEPALGDTQEGGPLVVRVKPRPRVDQSKPLPAVGSKPRAARDPIDPDSVANLIRQIEKTRDVAEAEYKTFSMTNVERLKAVELAKAEAAARADVEKGVRDNAALTVDEINRITEAAKATAEFKDKLQDLKEERELVRGSGADFMKGFAADMRNGVGVVDALTNAIGRLAQRLGDKALDNLADILFGKSGGGQPGILSGVFGGGNPFSFVTSLIGGATGAGAMGSGFDAVNAGAVGSFEWLHEGGIAGAGSSTRTFPLSVLQGAPRFHKGNLGLGPDEIPAILQRGEPVLSRRTAKNLSNAIGTLSGMQGGGGETTVNVHPPAGTAPQVTKRRGSSGPTVDVMIQSVMGNDLAANGPLAQMLQDTYGLNRMAGKQR